MHRQSESFVRNLLHSCYALNGMLFFCTAFAMQIIGEWMLRECYDVAAVVSAVFTLCFAANLVRKMLL